MYSWAFKVLVQVAGRLARLTGLVELDDQVEACRRIFASDTRWTVVRGSGLEEGESQGLPVWSRHVGDPIFESNLTRRVDFALFMVEAIGNDDLVHEAPAIVGCKTPSALAHAPPLTWKVEQLPGGVLCLAFVGGGGLDPGGYDDHGRMGEAIREVLAVHGRPALVIDFSGFTYRFEDWIIAEALMAQKALGVGRVCVLATGRTGAALRSEWMYSKLDAFLPLFGELSSALAYLSDSDKG